MTTIRPSSTRRVAAALGVAALLALAPSAGDPGTVRASDTCGAASPGAGDYCASSTCGPCGDGEGDCDPGQCASGLTCVEEGAIDHCRPVDGSCDAAAPGASDYCSSSRCGPCLEGEGDCDPGQCASGLTCVEEGAVDHCRVVGGSCGAAAPDASDYCSSSTCGPCGEGEGDCDPGQCGPGLSCVEEGTVDRCRPVDIGAFEVKIDGVWEGVCCVDGRPKVSDRDCGWSEVGRILTDETAGRQLDCPEGGPADCKCDGSGEKLHGWNGDSVSSSIDSSSGGPVYPDYRTDTCVYVKSNGYLATQWTSSSCPRFRLDD